MTFWELIDQTEALIRKKLEEGDLKGAEELRNGVRDLGRGMVAFDDQMKGKVTE